MNHVTSKHCLKTLEEATGQLNSSGSRNWRTNYFANHSQSMHWLCCGTTGTGLELEAARLGSIDKNHKSSPSIRRG
jgi:hypothetical protein